MTLTKKNIKGYNFDEWRDIKYKSADIGDYYPVLSGN
jgi:hypothetical protein